MTEPKKFSLILVENEYGDIESRFVEIRDYQTKIIADVAKAIKNFEPYHNKIHYLNIKHSNNFPTGECCREYLGEYSAEDYYVNVKKTISPEDFKEFEALLPTCYHGFRSITEIKIMVVSDEIKIL